jgi:hypothetical protein
LIGGALVLKVDNPAPLALAIGLLAANRVLRAPGVSVDASVDTRRQRKLIRSTAAIESGSQRTRGGALELAGTAEFR